MAALSLLPLWAVHVRALGHRAGRRSPAARSASAPRSTTATAPAATARPARAASAARSPRARSSRRSRTSRTSCASSTSARPTTTSPASPSYGDPRPRGRPAHRRVVRADAGLGRDRRRRADRRRDPRRRLPRALHAQRRRPDGGRHREEFDDWCAEDSPIYAALEAGTTLADLGTTPILDNENQPIQIIPIGDKPAEGSAALTVTVEPGGLAGPAASTITTDVLVVGGGPAGAAAAYWLARHGHDVTVVERKTFPREKTCGDGLTPRAVKQLADMGLEPRAQPVPPLPRACGRRAWAASSSSSGRRTRSTRSTATSCAAASSTRSSPPTPPRAGATLLEGHEAVHPLIERGFVRGAVGAASRRRAPIDVRAELHRSSPTAPTAASVGPSARSGLASGRTARRSARTGSRRSTPSRGSSRRSTSRTATATRCPATAGSSRSATAP